MVEVVGTSEGAPKEEVALKIVGEAGRFRVRMTPAEKESQIERRARILSQQGFPPFSPRSEEELEDWVDSVVGPVNRSQLCVRLFQEAWEASAAPLFARKIGRVPTPETHEELVNSVALELFKDETYVKQLELKVMGSYRCASGMEARAWVEDNLARFERLCRRRNYVFAISDKRVIEIALNAVPKVLEDDVRRFLHKPNWDQLWERVEQQERYLITDSNRLPEPVFALAAEEGDKAMQSQNGARRGPVNEGSVTCFCCGEKGHFKMNCPKRNYRCENCHRLGHVSAACRNLTIKDNRGRVETIVEPKQTGTVTSHRRDRGHVDRLITVESVMEKLKETAQNRAKAASQRRTTKNAEKATPPKRLCVDHPVGLAEEKVDESNQEEESSAEEEYDQFIVEFEQALRSGVADEEENVFKY